MKKKVISIIFFAITFFISVSAQTDSTPWWKSNRLRVIQVNLPDYEAATLQADSLVEDLTKYSANTVIINAGGIMAFYPTKLPFHYTNPYMKPNTLGVYQRRNFWITTDSLFCVIAAGGECHS